MTQPPRTTSLAVVDVPDRCGNAPRKAVLRDFTIALYERDLDGVTPLLSDRVQWTHVGDRVMVGADAVTNWVSAQPAARELHLTTIITHGTECGLDGEVTYADGTRHAFCHIVLFTGASHTAKVKTVRSYVTALA